MHSNKRSTSPHLPARPRSPTSSYGLATSRSHTGIGGASGFLNSSHSSDEPYIQSLSGVRRSPTTPYRNTFSPPRVPLFEDLPPHLYSRYTDSQDYLSRHSRNTFSRRLQTATSSTQSYLSPSSGYSTRDWNSPSSFTPIRPAATPATTDDSLSPGYIFSRTPSPYSSSPNSTKSGSPVHSFNTHIVHEPTARPFSPTSIPSRSTFEHRPTSPTQPVVFVRTHSPLSRREEIMVSRSNDYSDALNIGPDTQQLIQETELAARDLDHQIDLSNRFMQEIDEKMSNTSDQRRHEGSAKSQSSTPRPRSWNSNEENVSVLITSEPTNVDEGVLKDVPSEINTASQREPSRKIDDQSEMSVLEVEIGDEDDLVRALRKSAERMTKASPKPSSDKANKKNKQNNDSGTEIRQRNASRAGYEDTVSSYELRMKEAKKPEEDVLKKYLPAIIGGLVVLLIIFVMLNTKSASKSKTVVKKAVKDAAKTVCKETMTQSKDAKKGQEKVVKIAAKKAPRPKVSEKAIKAATDTLSKATAKYSEKVVPPTKTKPKNTTVKAVKISAKATDVTIEPVGLKLKVGSNATIKAVKKGKTQDDVKNTPIKSKTRSTKASDVKVLAEEPAKKSPPKKVPKLDKLKDCVEEENPVAKPSSTRTVKSATNGTVKGTKKVVKDAVNVTVKVTTIAAKKKKKENNVDQ